jgi:RNA polymerase sigma factor (sigma-70 family)
MNTEPSFLERVASGDPLAVEGCVTKYRGLVWSIARQFSRNHADAEDAVQEVFIELWRHAARFDPTIAAESTFVATVARRRFIDRQRRHARQPGMHSLAIEPAAATPSETERLEMADEGRRAREMLTHLRPEQRQVLELSIDEGLSQQEIAEATRLPLGTVKTHTRRGLMRLRQLLETGSTGATSKADSHLPNAEDNHDTA